MNELVQKNTNFTNIYNKSYRLAAAVFLISNVIDQNEELKTKIRNLSLNLVSMSVGLKDINFPDTKKLIIDIEKNALELMSVLDIACISGLVSKMNSQILNEEFQFFISELGKFAEKFENVKNASVKNVFMDSSILDTNGVLSKTNVACNVFASNLYGSGQGSVIGNNRGNEIKNGNGRKRKDMRKNTILDFVKGHNIVSIKDITANITGCSEKTVQRELVSLINEGKIKKTGERRWSKYSVIPETPDS